MLPPFIRVKGHVDEFTAEGIATSVIDTGGQAARSGGEFLNLLDAQVVLFKKESDIDNIVERTAGM